MATSADVAVLREANGAIETLVLGYLRDFWASLDLSRPEAARNALLEFVPVLTAEYGGLAAATAADWYDNLRASERVPGQFRAVLAEPMPAQYVEQRVRYGARHLFTDTPGQMLNFLDGAVQEYTLQPGRDTVRESSLADPQAVGWHRETRPSQSFVSGCRFCRMLAGRPGDVYKRATAVFAAHGDCKCVAVPSWDADAQEVPVEVYKASERTSKMTAEQKAEHNRAIREYLDTHFPIDHP